MQAIINVTIKGDLVGVATAGAEERATKWYERDVIHRGYIMTRENARALADAILTALDAEPEKAEKPKAGAKKE